VAEVFNSIESEPKGIQNKLRYTYRGLH